jgi:superfamily I DNA/RNA helicase
VTKDATAEAKLVGGEIADLLKEGRRGDDIAVLYRSNLTARLIEEELRERGIAYQLYGGTKFFDRKEVKDAAGYLRAVVNAADDISLRRIVNYPARGIGTKTIERLDAYAEERGCSFGDALKAAGTVSGVPDSARASIANLLGLLREATEAQEKGTSLVQIARRLFDAINLRADLTAAADGGPQGELRYKNVEYLIGWLERYEAKATGTARSLQNFLERVTLRGDPEDANAGEGVVLSTLHAAKGLEFGVVFLIGCVEGQLPHSRTTDPKVTETMPADVEEERRLFYVGVTRARDRLYITRPEMRQFRGENQKLAPSRFLNDLPQEELEEYTRAEVEPPSFDEIADLSRAFLARLAAKSPARQP